MKTLALAAALVVAGATAAPAATLTATATGANGNNPSFTIEFEDVNGNGLFDIDELTSFSGFTLGPSTVARVLAVPEIGGIAVAGLRPGARVGDISGLWYFDANPVDNQWNVGIRPNSWTYEITGLTPVPVPAALPLLLAGLGGLALLRRRARG
jgi:hypothetical protein